MKIRSKYVFSILGGALLLTSCSDDLVPGGNTVEGVRMPVTVTVDRNADATRTSLRRLTAL